MEQRGTAGGGPGEDDEREGQGILAAQLAQAIEADFGHLASAPAMRMGLVDYDFGDEDAAADERAGVGEKKRKRGDEELEHVESGEVEEQPAAVSRARGAGGACESCGGEGRYRCPRCGRRSCGVACVRRHKEETGCTGVRDRTAFVPLRAMTDTHLHSDFNFLQDCMRVSDVTHLNRPKMNSVISKRFRIFLYQCRRRHIRVHLLPQGMSKRKQNTSYYNIKEDKMLWKIEWRFPQCANSKLFSDRVPEAQTLQESLHAVLTEPKNKPENPARYAELAPERLRFLMRVERLPANEEKYFLLTGDQSLRSALENTELVEFPCFLVLSDDELRSHAATYTVVDKQDILGTRTRDHQQEQQNGSEGTDEDKDTVPSPAPAGEAPVDAIPANTQDDKEEEEEGFSFAVLVDY